MGSQARGSADRVGNDADRAWERAGLTDRLRLHQARHTFASFMIAAGVNAKALASYMGHSSITVTIDLYGHLMPGSEAEAAGLLDGYLTTQLERETERARAAAAPALTGTGLGDSVGDETPSLA